MKERIEEIVKEACLSEGVSLYDLQWKNVGRGRLLLVRITRLGGVSITDCRRVSRFIDNQLEENDPIQGRYSLEVSSPGLERELTKKSHFVSAINENVMLTVQGKEENTKVKGILKEVNPKSIMLLSEAEGLVDIPLNSIKKAKIFFDASLELKAAKQAEKNKE